MARLHGSDLTVVSVDNAAGTPVVMLAETLAVNFEHGADTHDTTTMGDDNHEFTAGLKGGQSITHELFFDDTVTTGLWAVYAARIGVSGTLTITGVRTIAMETIVTNLSLPVKVDDMVKFTATHLINGAVTYS